MPAIVTELKPEEFPVVIEWFSTQEPPKPAAAPQDEIGANLVAELGCLDCHTKMADAVPFISAQHAGYLEKQMTDFTSGARDSGNIHKDLLTPVSSNIGAIAAYLSSVERNE